MSPQTTKIVKQIEEKLLEYFTISDDMFVIALSGGSDSIALAHIMLKLSNKHGFRVCAYHLNHGLRGEESIDDENFVKEWCKNKELELQVEKAVNLEDYRRMKDFSLEEAARDLRYEMLSVYAKSLKAKAVITGHTLNDDIETFFLRCITGGSLNSLAGIYETAKIEGIIVFRPLLGISKAQLRKYLIKNGENWCEDSTNYESDLLRNRVRHELIPHIDKVFDRDITLSLGRTIGNLKRDRGLLLELIDIENMATRLVIPFESNWKTGYFIEVSKLRMLNRALRYRILIWAFDRLGFPLKRRKEYIFKLMDHFVSLKGGKKHHHVGDGIYISRSGKAFAVVKTKTYNDKASFNPKPSESDYYIKEMRSMSESGIMQITSPGTYKLGEVEITVESVDKTDMNRISRKESDKATEYFDPSILDGGIDLVFGGTITGSDYLEHSCEYKDEYRCLGNKAMVDQWVKWPVIKKEDEIIWIIGVCKRTSYNEISGDKALKISAKIPPDVKLFM